MDYTFGTNDYTGVETLKTVGAKHTDLTGFRQTVREYPDCIITDNFRVVKKMESAEDPAGNYYDWYVIDHHNRIIDRTPPLKRDAEDTDALLVDQEYRLTLLELNITET